jgi:hypothetical protein
MITHAALFKRAVYKFPRRKIVVNEDSKIWGVDLADYSKDPFPGYILVCVNYFDRKMYATRLANKNDAAISAGLAIVFKEAKEEPLKIHADRESALIHNKFLKEKGITVYHTNMHGSPIAERAIRTIKEIIEINRRAARTKDWKPHVAAAVATYNARLHTTLGMSPNAAHDDNDRAKEAQAEIANENVKEPKNKLKLGDNVVVVRVKDKFEKGYTAKWDKTIYNVKEVIHSNPTMYRLNNNKTYYQQQLQKI